MIGFFIFIHSLCAVLLATVILMQSGRGGGLTDTFASAESMFGAKTNDFMVRATVVLAAVFLSTSLTLAHLSSKKERSLIPEKSATKMPAKRLPPITVPAPEAAAKNSSPAVVAVPVPAAAKSSSPVAAPVPAATKSSNPATVVVPTNKM